MRVTLTAKAINPTLNSDRAAPKRWYSVWLFCFLREIYISDVKIAGIPYVVA